MSLGIVFKGPEGIVLAADSRVTLFGQVPQQEGQPLLLPATFDNATKLLRANGQKFVGAVTYGLGSIASESGPRTAHSLLPEFEAQLSARGEGRLGVEEFAKRLAEFFMGHVEAHMPGYRGEPMLFLVGGFDQGDTYGRVFELNVPHMPDPREMHAGSAFGVAWGGQKDVTHRLINGYDVQALEIARKTLNLTAEQVESLREGLKQLTIEIPYAFLPLQDCVDLSIFLIRTTMTIQTWQIGVRGVGGAIDVATITRTDGFRPVQQKAIRGETSIWET